MGLFPTARSARQRLRTYLVPGASKRLLPPAHGRRRSPQRRRGRGEGHRVRILFPYDELCRLRLVRPEIVQGGDELPRGGAEVRSFWDTFGDLVSTLWQSGPERGIAVTVRYLDLAGAYYEDVWAINPLLYEGDTITGYKGMNDLVVVAERISDNVEALTRSQSAASGDDRREA